MQRHRKRQKQSEIIQDRRYIWKRHMEMLRHDIRGGNLAQFITSSAWGCVSINVRFYKIDRTSHHALELVLVKITYLSTREIVQWFSHIPEKLIVRYSSGLSILLGKDVDFLSLNLSAGPFRQPLVDTSFDSFPFSADKIFEYYFLIISSHYKRVYWLPCDEESLIKRLI